MNPFCMSQNTMNGKQRPTNAIINKFAGKLRRYEWGDLEWVELKRRACERPVTQVYKDWWHYFASPHPLVKALNIPIDEEDTKRIAGIEEALDREPVNRTNLI